MNDAVAPPRPSRRGRWFAFVFLWLPLGLLVGASALALSSLMGTRAVEGATRGLTLGLLFVVAPLLWHGLAARGRAHAPADGRGGLRLAMRAGVIAAVATAVMIASVGTRPWLRALADTPGLGWLGTGRPFGTLFGRDLLSYVPRDAHVVAMIDFSQVPLERVLSALGGKAGASASGGSSLLAGIAACGVDWKDARALLAMSDGGRFALALRHQGLREQGKLSCVARKAMGPIGLVTEVVVDRTFDPWVVRSSLPLPMDAKMFLDDRGTLVVTTSAWAELVKVQLSDGGGGATAGPLAAALGRVDAASALWLVTHTAGPLLKGDLALAVDVKADGALHARATLDPGVHPGRQEPVTMTFVVPPATLKTTLANAAAPGLTEALAAGLRQLFSAAR